MVINDTRRRLLRQLNSRYIYGRYPLLHAIVALIQITMVSILIRKFNAYYQNRPVFTTMITNAVLGGIADTVAQTLTAFQRRQRQRHGHVDTEARGDSKDDFFSVEIRELGKRVPWPERHEYKQAPPPFDFERMVRFMAYPFIMAPLQHRWFGFLNTRFPVGAGSGGGTMNAFRRVAFDQLLFAPCGLAAFFAFMTIAEGGGHREVKKKFQDVYIPALKANFIVWPAVQLINFRLMPIQFQIPFVSTVGIFWTAYLSLTNSAEDENIGLEP
ncbi:hypothetical protein KC332_g14684 [Hortaea werneckii]|uniref:Protein sym1 n=1 Tax=Hortaea werneckii EXF-2000 TaxID=1157616 RepID=A0A1Z5T5H8_HORWE|nr:hypothetical protein KC358_g6939 [Hortaea werneckii]OTA31218.1 hypothetical protein BTJ68_08960 [Hortaea werneckii EXF-2000]KAI6830014.1 hypothetical protein KC350_g7685 [Hortaea werneckii]KAI6862798.1 hypothetical protein KC323_g5300 [Hortaea werneckii]KAI6865768.1 hypothetical protein KC338_g4945 [Hortaea werneckii]